MTALEQRIVEASKQWAPSAERNREPILEVLRTVLPASGLLLEVASGTGQHAAAFAGAFPNLRWQPSDAEPAMLSSIEAHRRDSGLENLGPPVAVDLMKPQWTRPLAKRVDAILAINVLHISPFEVSINLVRGAADLLSERGVLVIYGCFKRHGDWVSESNASFDQQLREREPYWGVRDVSQIEDLAKAGGLVMDPPIAMPANNTMLVVRRPASR